MKVAVCKRRFDRARARSLSVSKLRNKLGVGYLVFFLQEESRDQRTIVARIHKQALRGRRRWYPRCFPARASRYWGQHSIAATIKKHDVLLLAGSTSCVLTQAPWQHSNANSRTSLQLCFASHCTAACAVRVIGRTCCASLGVRHSKLRTRTSPTRWPQPDQLYSLPKPLH